MEPQTEKTNSPEQDQTELTKDSFRSIVLSPRYWLAVVLPILGLYVANIIVDKNYDYLFLILILPTFVSLIVNILLPFVINIRRAIYLSLSLLGISAVLFLYSGNRTPEVSPGDNLLICLPALSLILAVVFLGWIGAMIGIAIRPRVKDT